MEDQPAGEGEGDADGEPQPAGEQGTRRLRRRPVEASAFTCVPAQVCGLQAELARLRSSLERGEAQRAELQFQLTVSRRDGERAAELSRDREALAGTRNQNHHHRLGYPLKRADALASGSIPSSSAFPCQSEQSGCSRPWRSCRRLCTSPGGPGTRTSMLCSWSWRSATDWSRAWALRARGCTACCR